MLREEQAITEKLKNMQNEVSGTIRVGVSNFFALNKMPKLYGCLRKNIPRSTFKLSQVGAVKRTAIY